MMTMNFLDQNLDERTTISEPPFEIYYLVYEIIIGMSEVHLLIDSSLSSLMLHLRAIYMAVMTSNACCPELAQPYLALSR